LQTEGRNPAPLEISATNLSRIEHHEVFVGVVEIASILLVEVVGELALGVVIRSHSLIKVGDTKSFMVKHDRKDTTLLDGGAARRRYDVDFAGISIGKGSSRTLPVGNTLSVDELGVVVMEGVRLEEHIGCRGKLGEHDHVREVTRSESLLTADIEQGGHDGEPVHIQAENIGGKADKLGSSWRFSGAKCSAITSVVE